MYVFSTALQTIQKTKSAAAPRARAVQKFPEDVRLGKSAGLQVGLAEQRRGRFPALCGSSAAAGGEGPWLWAPAGQEICRAEGIQKAEIICGYVQAQINSMPRAVSVGMVLEEVLLCIDQAFVLGNPGSSSGGGRCDVPCLSSVLLLLFLLLLTGSSSVSSNVMSNLSLDFEVQT